MRIEGAETRVEFCGSIGTGKSTIARLLAAHFKLPLVEEHYAQVPFWKDFYQDPLGFSFEKNICFLLFHSNAVRAAARKFPVTPLICDFALFQDLAYEAMSEYAENYFTTVGVYERLIDRLRLPGLIVHVQCSVGAQLERIRLRGREPELSITKTYLEDLSENIEIELKRRVPVVPIVEINTDELDFVVDPSVGLAALSLQFEDWLADIATTTTEVGDSRN